ncbi:MAG: AAA family ATPase [Blastocatellia bacterium]|nr:AAA family ATPase [Blastocatellia bacterium]
MRLTEKQREIIESPIRGALFLRGPAGAGKTTTGVHRMRHLIENGVSAHSILVLVPQKRLALPYLTEIRNPRRKAGAEVTVATLGSLAFQMVNLFWPLATDQLSQRDPYRRPVFLSLELVQYLMFKLLDPEILRNDRFKSVRIGQTRLFSQIADNLIKSSLVGFPHTQIAARLKSALPGDSEREHIFEDAQVCANLFRDYCVEQNLLDFSLQVSLFVDHLWRQEVPRAFLMRRYAHIIADNLEEDTPVTHSLLADWLPHCRSALLIHDHEAGYRRFLGADEISAASLETACESRHSMETTRVMSRPVRALMAEVNEVMTGEDAEIPPRQRVLARKAIEFTPAARSRFHTQMLDWIVESIAGLIRDEGVKPGRTVILAPLLGDALRFSLVSRLDRLDIPSYTLRPSRPLHAEPAVRALITLAKLAHPDWKLDPKDRVKEFDVTQMLLSVIDELDLTRASLLTGVLFGAKESRLFSFSGLTKNPELRARISEVFGERYDRLVAWLDACREGEAGPLDVFFGRLFGEVLSQKGFGFHRQFDEARIVANLIDSARAFRRTLAEIEPDADIGCEYVRMVDAGILADQYEPQAWKKRPDAVLIAPAYTFLLSNQPVDYQFWLNLDSPAWTRRLFQPLTQPYVLSRQWPKDQVWTEADEQRTSRDILHRVVTGLLRRCRRKIFIGYSKFDERGNEQIGELRTIFDLVLREK